MNKEITLTIDSTAKIWSVSLFANKLELGTIIGTDETPLSKHLVSKIYELLLVHGIKSSDISLIGVCIGPGSFTGLRVGLSTVKGFKQALNCEVVGVPLLDILAYSVSSENKILSLITTNQNQIYFQEFKINRIKKGAAKLLPIEEFCQLSVLTENYQLVTNFDSAEVLKKHNFENISPRIKIVSGELARYLANLISEPNPDISRKLTLPIYL